MHAVSTKFQIHRVAMLLAVAVVVLCAATAWAWPILRMCWVARKLPGPPVWTLPAHALSFRHGTEFIFSLIGKIIATHGPVFGVFIGSELAVVIASADDAQQILAHPDATDRSSMFYAAVRGVIFANFSTSEGETARARRRLVAPAFHAARLNYYIADFDRNADRMCARIAKMADGRSMDIYEEMSTCTLVTIFETVIGVQMQFKLPQLLYLREQLDLATKLILGRLMNPLLLFDCVFERTKDWKKFQAGKKTCLEMFSDALTAKREAPSQPHDAAEPPLKPRKNACSFLDAAYDPDSNDGKPLTTVEIFEEFLGLTFAGMETTAFSMSYTLMMLGIHPEYQQSVYEEQQAIFGDSLRGATMEDIARMKTLEMVVKETMRLFPVAQFHSRQIPVDVTLASGAVVPAGAAVYVSNYHLHRNPDNFVEPDRFWPERWLPENSVGRHAYAYLPFGAGARKCVGYKYAMLQMKSVLGRVVREFSVGCRYSMQDLQRIEISLTTVSVSGYDVQLTAR